MKDELFDIFDGSDTNNKLTAVDSSESADLVSRTKIIQLRFRQ